MEDNIEELEVNDSLESYYDIEESPEYPIEDWNATLLYFADRAQFLKLLTSKDTGEYTINYYLDVLSDSDETFWTFVLTKLVSYYHLTPLETTLLSMDKDIEFIEETKKLVFDIKVVLKELVQTGVVSEITGLEEMQRITEENFKSKYSIDAIKYMSLKNYHKFLKKALRYKASWI